MGNPLFRSLRRASSFTSILNVVSSSNTLTSRLQTSFFPSNPWWVFRNLSHGSVNLVISQGKPKFETHEIDPPKKEKWKTKKRLKQQRMREKQKRKAANKRDPRWLGVKGKKKKKFANAEERIKDKLEKALEKSKYEQSLESVKHFIAIAEKELELYYRHVALYGSPNSRSPNSILDSPKRGNEEPKRIEPTVEGNLDSTISGFSPALSEAEIDSTDHELSETEDDFLDEDPSVGEIDLDDDNVSRNDLDSCDEGEETLTKILGSSPWYRSGWDADNQAFQSENKL